MASGTAKTMREEATCPICLDLMTEPVIIDCGHIYCRSCILENLEKQQQQSPSQGNFQCPTCRAQFQRESIRPSKQLESIIDTIKKMEQEHLCEEHGEKLSLFCEDDGQLICLLCERTPQHKGHTTVLAADAYKDYKKNFQESLTYLWELEEKNWNWQRYIRTEMGTLENIHKVRKLRIQNRFKLLHMILKMEEESYLWRVENEKEQVQKRQQDTKAQLEKQSQELSELIQELKRKCQGSAQELLKDVKDTLDRISAMKLNAPEDVSLHIQIMPEFDNIFCQLMKTFETDYVKVTILEPVKLALHLDKLVRKNEIMVADGSPQVKHDTPARFGDLAYVLGCKAITSGKHYLGMFCVTGSVWEIGVCLENVPRDNDITRDPESGFWAIRHCEDDNYVALTSPPTPICWQNLRCVGVFLDYEAGLVSFYNVNTFSHIFTFPQASFSEPIRPYSCISEDSYLSIVGPYL